MRSDSATYGRTATNISSMERRTAEPNHEQARSVHSFRTACTDPSGAHRERGLYRTPRQLSPTRVQTRAAAAVPDESSNAKERKRESLEFRTVPAEPKNGTEEQNRVCRAVHVPAPKENQRATSVFSINHKRRSLIDGSANREAKQSVGGRSQLATYRRTI